jgi:Asp-tRNA(Asn)/Glu-tRNA(Gln) amidotransferase A subunit family amidase/Asp-tRNA(Asn)/Glu-tRNA(Gln) amidotransferase C subunit
VNDRDDIAIRRRAFLSWCTGAGLGATAFPGALWAQVADGEGQVTLEMIDHAARLAGLEFSREDRERMLAGMQANLEGFRELHALDIDQNVPPPLYFNPAVPGQVFDDTQRPFVLGARRKVTRPNDLEEIAFWPVTELSVLMETRQVSSVELTELYLDRIRRYDPVIRAVITVTEERAREQARAMDEEIAAGRYRGPLHGIPWGAKDLLATKDYRTTWGFKAYENQVIDMDATVVERLDAAGAVLIAKLSTGEIARGDQWLGIQTKNPWKTDEGSGGSSAGPGAATAAGLVGFSIGTDTTGSILGPSRTCGITGLRPTFGRVSRHGVMPVCWSLDKVGPMCRAVEDCAIVFDAIAGPDGQDLAVVDKAFNWDGNTSVDGLRVGYLASAFERDDDNAAALENDLATLEWLRSAGVSLMPVEMPLHADMDALQMLLVDEAAAFDELVHNGNIDLFRQDIDEPEDMLMRIARLHPAVEYVQIQRRRMLLMQGMATIFNDIDILVAPFSGSPVQSATSLTGHPAVAIQNGFDAAGKPTGIQFIGQLYGEASAMALAKRFQEQTGFHRQHPPGFS